MKKNCNWNPVCFPQRFKHLLLAMKLTILLTLLLSLNVSASVYSQNSKLDLTINNQTVKDVLKIVESKTSYRFFYSDDFNALDKTVSCDLHQATLEAILLSVLRNTQATYTKLENNVIVISPFSVQQQNKLTGTVTDATTNEPIVGAIVAIDGTTIGVLTDVNGRFTINLPKSNAVIKVTFMGYLPETIALKGQTKIDIKLTSDVKRLDEVVVVGYGTVRKKDLTGTVSSIKTADLVKSPAGNVMEAVQGKVSGVDIIRSDGRAGAGINITVRGNRSINAGNDPLYIVDGIQYSNIQDINPNDISSMDVLKDASTTAIYGSRGANGVIIITTKRGSEGKIKVTAGTYYGVSEVAGYPKPMNGTQFADLKRQAFKTSGTWNSTADDAKVFTPAEIAAISANTSVDWAGLMLNKGSQQDYIVGVSGGTEKTKVYFSFDYFKENGLLSNDYSNRYTLRLNIDQAITDNFKVGLESQLAYYDQNLRNDGVLNQANKILPYYTPYGADGLLTRYPGNGSQFNPLLNSVLGNYVNQNNITRLLSTAYAEWKPFTGLVIRSNLGVVNASSRNGHYEDANTISRGLSTGSLSSITNTTQADLTWENIITYQKKIGDHSLNLTAITSYLSNRSDNSSASGTGQLLAGQSYYALQNNPVNLAISSNYVGSNLESGAFRFNYSFKEKYLLAFTGREDGASVLAPKNRWSFFPSAAVAWRVIDENFMKNIPVISDLKLRGSIGIAGNSAVKPYQTQSGLMLIPFAWNDVAALAYGLQPQIGNDNLNWELTTTQNIGIDFGILKNRITGSIDMYDSKTKDLLYLQQLPPSTGGYSMLTNSGKTRNKGIELSIKTVNIQSNDFSWTSNISYSRNKETIVFLPNGNALVSTSIIGYHNTVGSYLIMGSPVNSFYDYKKIGIWQTADAALAASYGYKPGDIRVMDISGPDGVPDGKITALYDKMVIGSAVPLYSVGFNNDFKFKNFDLNIFIYARIGQTFISDYANKFEPNAIQNGSVVDYWTPENPTNAYPRPDSRVSNSALPFATTLGYQDGSFVKVRNITLGYTLPSSLTKKLHVTSIRWYASAKNYLTFSKVKGYDPEGGGSFEGPLTKLIVTGLTVEF